MSALRERLLATAGKTLQRAEDAAITSAVVHGRRPDTDSLGPIVAGLRALMAVVELHKPEPYSQRQANRWFVCAGCDIDGYEAEHPEWPCSTIATIARELGVEIGETQ